MIHTKAASSKTLMAESEQAIHFLANISDQLKQQHRHFDDAVVTHCIRLINDHMEEKSKVPSTENSLGTGRASHSNARRS